jgi:cell wall-associated NlpC family hydrolase
MHWSAKYIGMPYEPGARGHHGSVDCWGLLYWVYAREFNILLPLYPGLTIDYGLHPARVMQSEVVQNWKEITTPFDGAAVAMSHKDVIHHVGIYASSDPDRVIHSWDFHPVVAETLRGIKIKGIKTVTFYRHNLWPAL